MESTANFPANFPATISARIKAHGMTIPAILNQRRIHHPENSALSFLKDGEGDVQSWSYGILAGEFNRISLGLERLGIRGERVILLFEPGLDYVAAFLGCLASGAVAVPAYPPGSRRFTDRILGIIADCRPKCILTTRALAATYRDRLGEAGGCEWVCADEFPQVGGAVTDHSALDSLAMLQYTSGSTGRPKGVMISHGNIIANCASAAEWLGEDPGRVGGIWLPPYHDMGLLGGILQPLYSGFPLFFMSPMHFIQSPARWLRMISDHGVTLSGAPNFAYDLCFNAIRDEDAANLDLSRWTQAFCGAEMIHPGTLQRFVNRFGEKGLREDAITPCYGLAESTLIVSGKRKGALPRYAALDREQLDAGRVSLRDIKTPTSIHLSSCGAACSEYQVRIVEPESLRICNAREVGEIWVAGASVAGGYWEKPQESAATFGGRLEGDARRYLRTGDLGFLLDGDLFVTGRIKDLVVIAGANHYPEDLELTAKTAMEGMSVAAAFSVTEDSEERLVLLLECSGKQAELPDSAERVRSRVTSMHGITPHHIVFVRTGAIPRTTSGKIRRTAAREWYQSQRLAVAQSDSQAGKAVP
jgi:acyl-CoA synthetase (AMP-forming)/AMP-acid ligase II